MNRILVTGADGQLGCSLQTLAPTALPATDFLFTDVNTLDICNKEALAKYVVEARPAYIVNCAAYTAVDKAEDDEIVCMRINSEAVRNVGEAAATVGAKVIHISTDYVFDGTNSLPYVETDYTCPMSAYGRSKQTGELFLRAVCQDSIIIRTAWLYSEVGKNFLLTMLKLGKERSVVEVVFDQVGTPTYAYDLADAILRIIAASEEGCFKAGIFHYSNEGVCSWYDFARKIFELAGLTCRAVPIESKNYSTRAVRPQYSVLNKAKIKQTYGLVIPHWEDSLKKAMKNINLDSTISNKTN